MLSFGCFFLRFLHENNRKFTALFSERDEEQWDDGEGSNGGVDKFTEHFGWIYNAKMVSEFENIKLSEVWELPVIQFLNDLSYLKIKQQKDKADADKYFQSTKRGY